MEHRSVLRDDSGMTEKTDVRAKVYDLLKSFSTAMFVTLGPTGRPEARPMHVASAEDEAADVCCSKPLES